ncbi:MAG: hypothetical protein FJX71_00800 [Alphaproteobacteria bacterium]|nr:hypothetical protein [Alphaproteobacteria bacterium]
MSHYAYKIDHLLSVAPINASIFYYPTPRNSSENEQNKDFFLVGLQEISPKLYLLHAQDLKHHLRSIFPLEIHEVLMVNQEDDTQNSSFVPMLTATLPPINGEILLGKLDYDENLYRSLLLRFYLNLLESLFLLSDNEEAGGLILSFESNNEVVIDLYSNFGRTGSSTYSEGGGLTRLIVPTDLEAYDALMSYIEKTDRAFHQMLWREQRGNLTIRTYLKSFSPLLG